MTEPYRNASAYLVDRHVDGGLGDRVAVRHEGRDTSYAELLAATARAGGAWQSLGVRREERVMLCMPDTPQLLAGILGAFRIGAVAVPVSTMFTGRELGGVLSDSGARVLVVGGELADVAVEALAQAPEVRHLVVLGHGTDGAAHPAVPGVDVTSWDALVETAAEAELADASEDAQALWLYTSGTTGRPKAAMHRHANVRHVCETYGRKVLGIRPDDRCLSVAKLFFAYGLGNGALFPLSVGATTILEPRRSTPQVVADRIRADAPTLLFGVPTFFAAMLSADLPSDLLAGVRLATSAGEALPAPLMQRWTSRFGVDILDGLGSTEALHIFVSNAPGDIGPGTSGRAVPGYEIEVRAEDGTPAPPGVPGSLFVRGESIALGYWCRTSTTRQVFQGEWLATGDTYVQGDDGRYTCLGRSNDMIKAGGMWVSPGEVEARLLEHHDVVEAAVIGVPDDAGLDKPVAYVVLRPDATATPSELVEHCRAGMAHFKAPRAVETVDALPRTATGKLQRFRVRELAADRTAVSS
ncbi:MAG TPA: benzoate-CoA ligase family protein [Actinomycetales bacterium]|nr:benzoate-CoA ligase family protein [Actinomycetales bacterium]